MSCLMISGARYSGVTNQSFSPLKMPYLLVSNLFYWISNSSRKEEQPHYARLSLQSLIKKMLERFILLLITLPSVFFNSRQNSLSISINSWQWLAKIRLQTGFGMALSCCGLIQSGTILHMRSLIGGRVVVMKLWLLYLLSFQICRMLYFFIFSSLSNIYRPFSLYWIILPTGRPFSVMMKIKKISFSKERIFFSCISGYQSMYSDSLDVLRVKEEVVVRLRAASQSQRACSSGPSVCSWMGGRWFSSEERDHRRVLPVL